MATVTKEQPVSPLVVVLAYEGLCTFEFGIAVEVFGLDRPEMGQNWYRFAVAGSDQGPMRAAGGVRIMTDGDLDLMADANIIVIPGWRGVDSEVPNDLINAVRQAHHRGARILSICSGVFVLAAAGLLDGRRATTHWRYTDALAARYPKIAVTPDVLYVDEGDVLTSAGSAAGLDLCLHVVRRDFGTRAANSVARRLVVQPHRDGGQAQFVKNAVPSPYESGRIGPLLDFLRENLAGVHCLDDLAKRVGMSKRTFSRRFEIATGTTPARWLLDARMVRARDLLEETDLPIESVAETVGFKSATLLRHHFRQQFATTPVAYRAAFGRRKEYPKLARS
ncbi:transcriptional regulator FtrA [Rhizobium leguminosarum]|uniref:transcriptional regulator FtrA n=1 Tax=Rhizobium leguminosarum TaxID=384 RepID=UPI00102FFC07|nr:transcriptional regulator FtrA [Rhizobium leguminosarum]TBF36977.1 transcriptional regulator FtrA [Rhizobium leguminosarum]